MVHQGKISGKGCSDNWELHPFMVDRTRINRSVIRLGFQQVLFHFCFVFLLTVSSGRKDHKTNHNHCREEIVIRQLCGIRCLVMYVVFSIQFCK